MNLRVLPDAEAEIEAARQYFNLQAFALGNRFLEDLEQTLERIESGPEGFPRLETLPTDVTHSRLPMIDGEECADAACRKLSASGIDSNRRPGVHFAASSYFVELLRSKESPDGRPFPSGVRLYRWR